MSVDDYLYRLPELLAALDAVGLVDAVRIEEQDLTRFQDAWFREPVCRVPDDAEERDGPRQFLEPPIRAKEQPRFVASAHVAELTTAGIQPYRLNKRNRRSLRTSSVTSLINES